MLSHEQGARHDPGASHYLGVRHDLGARHDPGALHDTGARHELAAGVSYHIKEKIPNKSGFGCVPPSRSLRPAFWASLRTNVKTPEEFK